MAIDDLNLIQYVDKLDAEIGEALTYDLEIKNTSDQDISNVVMTASIPEYTLLVSRSILVNGSIYPDTIPIVITKPVMRSGEVLTIQYKVLINDSSDTGNIIRNKGYISYEYLNQLGDIENVSLESNEKYTTVMTPRLDILKTTDKMSIRLGEVITYTILIENKGNVDIKNVVLEDELKPEISYIFNTLFVNEVQQNNRTIGKMDVLIGDIKKGEEVKVTFKARLMAIPESKLITNTSKASGVYNANIYVDSETNYQQVYLRVAYGKVKVVSDDEIYYLQKSNDVKTIVSEESINIVTSGIFNGEIVATDTGYIPFYNIVTTSCNIKSANGYIQIVSNKLNSIFRIVWSIQGEIPNTIQFLSNNGLNIQATDTNTLSGILVINNEEIAESMDVFEKCDPSDNKVKIGGEFTFAPGISQNYLALKYIGGPCSKIEILNASIEIVELDLN